MAAQHTKGPETQPEDSSVWLAPNHEVRELFIGGKHVKITLARYVWESLEEIGDREGMGLREIFDELATRCDGTKPSVLCRAAEVFSVSYFRHATPPANAPDEGAPTFVIRISRVK